nr:hypothetical protein [uncultured Ellagibacter sp.]
MAAPRALEHPDEGEVVPHLLLAPLDGHGPLRRLPQLVAHDRGHAALEPHVGPDVDASVLLAVDHVAEEAVRDGLPRRRAHAPQVQVAHHGRQGLAPRVPLEDLAHDGRLALVDDVAPRLGVDPVAVHVHAVVEALERLAAHGVARPLGVLDGLARSHSLQELLVDDALGGVGDVFHRRQHAHAVQRQLLLVDRRVEGIAREAVHHVDDHRVVGTGVAHHLLELRALVCAPRDGVVGVHAIDLVAAALRVLRANAHLVVDGRLALLVAREPRVDYSRLFGLLSVRHGMILLAFR